MSSTIHKRLTQTFKRFAVEHATSSPGNSVIYDKNKTFIIAEGVKYRYLFAVWYDKYVSIGYMMYDNDIADPVTHKQFVLPYDDEMLVAFLIKKLKNVPYTI